MLIRLVGHHKNNPKSIDKLIAIKGLPQDWIFNEGKHGIELKRPWTPEIDKNVPHDIRHLCDPMYVNFRYPPIEKGAQEVIEKRQIIGIVLDFMTEPGRELWEKIERYIEGTVPRYETVPDPVLCAKDEHSPFQTYAPRRNSTGSLELREADVPMIDLDSYQVQKVTATQVVQEVIAEIPKGPEIPEEPEAAEEKPHVVQHEEKTFSCQECHKPYVFEKALKRHVRNEHKKEKAVA